MSGTLVGAACASTTSPGAALDVAAHAGRVELPARLTSGRPPAVEGSAAPLPAPRATAQRPPHPLAAPPLPFRVHVSPALRALPSLPRFAVRFAPQCVTIASGHEGDQPKYTVHLQGAFAARGYTLRARYDGHTSRSLVLAKKGRTQLELDSLSNAWSPVTPGAHELVVFARDEHGVVPLTEQGGVAFDTCRFHIDRSGAVNRVVRHDQPVLLSPEGTLHGSASDVALMQLGARESLGRMQVHVTRPDSGTETHLLDATGRDGGSPSTALFEVAPLQNGDYTFALSKVAGSTDRGASGTAHALRISVNHESFGIE